MEEQLSMQVSCLQGAVQAWPPFEFQLPVLEADGEPALQCQRWASQVYPGQEGAEECLQLGMSGWTGLVRRGTLAGWQKKWKLCLGLGKEE